MVATMLLQQRVYYAVHIRACENGGIIMKRIASVASLVMCLAAGVRAADQNPMPDLNNAFFTVVLEGFFPGEARGGAVKRINIYTLRLDGKWISALGTPTIQGRPIWNTARMLVDPSGLELRDNRLTGTLRITLVPDPWVPKDQKARVATATIDATVGPPSAAEQLGTLSGTWKATIPGTDEELAAAGLQARGEGRISGGVGKPTIPDVSDASYDLAMYNLIPGKTGDGFHRRRAISLGVQQGKIVSARLGQMDMRHNMYDFETIETPDEYRLDPHSFSCRLRFQAQSLDGDTVNFNISLEGRRVADFMVGTWKGIYVTDDGRETPVEGFFRGDARKGAVVSEMMKDDRPWFVPVKDHRPFAPGEHPRLFFRKSDVPELRRRAETPEGKKIIARLRLLLNGSDGESMTTIFNPATKAYDTNKYKARPGAYSISHAAGYGFLYQLTGDAKYAGFARQCIEKAWAGQRSFDDRYSWVAPGGELRAGPTLGWYAVAYDLCYDAWDPEFRTKVALAIQNYSDTAGGEWNKPEGITLRKMVLTPKQGPASNHYGAVVGGSGLAVLAIKDDPGTDRELLQKYMEVLERQVVRHFLGGWGDGGYYSEGWGASSVGTQGGFLCFLQALKVAWGHDYMNVDRTSVSYLTMVPRCLMIIGPPAVMPYRSNMPPSYGSENFYRERDGFSHGGHYCENFGAIADKFKPALLWTYNHMVEPDREKDDFDTPSLYPHRPMMALINWPTFSGITEKNPAEVMPRVTRDRLYEYFVFRNRWQDTNDILTTFIINYPKGTRPRDVMVWGLGLRLTLGEPRPGAKVTHFQPGSDGSGTVTAGEFAIAIDYSGASGADALIITTAAAGKQPPQSPKARLLTLQGTPSLTVLTLSSTGQHPEIKRDGNTITAGGQTITFADGKFTLAKFRTQ